MYLFSLPIDLKVRKVSKVTSELYSEMILVVPFEGSLGNLDVINSGRLTILSKSYSSMLSPHSVIKSIFKARRKLQFMYSKEGWGRLLRQLAVLAVIKL
jgi:hypothetical protein